VGHQKAPNSLPADRPFNWFLSPDSWFLRASGFGALQRAPHPHCPRSANPIVHNVGFAYSGLGNVAGRRPLGDIILGAVITAARRPGGLHCTDGKKLN